MTQFQQTGLPGQRTARTATHRRILFSEQYRGQTAGPLTVKGSTGGDALNTGNVRTIRAGNMMGRITSGGLWAPSVLGVVTTTAVTGAATQVVLTAPICTEIGRRIGATGTFKITGPPTAAGTVRTLTATYSALTASSNTRATITALGVAQVEQINFNIASTGGNLQLRIVKSDGTYASTANAAWSATDATYLSNINTQLDAVTVAAGDIVATAIAATDTDLGIVLTYNNATYPAGAARAQVLLFPTTSTAAVYTPITTAVDGRFVVGSLIQPTDGSETIRLLVGDGYGIKCTDDTGADQDTEWQQFNDALVGGYVETSQIVNVPADTSLLAYVKAQLRLNGMHETIFSDDVS